jgi:CRP-like cAMP-binding protein
MVPTEMTPALGANVLRANGWLSRTAPEFQDRLLALCTWRWFEPGDAVVSVGSINNAIYGVADGSVDLVTSLGAPDTPLTHVSYAGFWTGYLPLVSGDPTVNATTARSRVYAAVVGRSALERLLADNPGWWRYIAMLCVTYGNLAANVAADLMLRDSRRRCAAALLRLADCRFDATGDNTAQVQVNHADLATVTNLSRQTAGLILSSFETQGMIARRYNHIELCDVAALHALVDEDRAV